MSDTRSALLWALLALPFLTACCALYTGLSKSTAEKKWALLSKSAGSCFCALSAAAGLLRGGGNPLGSLLFWGILLCSAADALLELQLCRGVAAFAGGHILFILWLLAQTRPSPASAVLFVLLYALAMLAFAKNILRQENPAARVLLFCYPALLGLMAALALPLPVLVSLAFLPAAAGAALFCFSDFLVAKGVFGCQTPRQKALVMPTYYGALFLLSLTPWLT